MSIESYRRNVKRRVAGPSKPICFPAALEQISPNHSYRSTIYPYYQEWVGWWWSVPRKHRDDYLPEAADCYTKLVRPLGLDSWEDAVYKRANTALGFTRIVRRLLDDGYRVSADLTYSGPAINGAHAVGILPIGEEGHVHLVSNHVHIPLQGIVSLQKVGERLALHPDRHYDEYPFNDSNIMALPPVN